MWKWTWDEKGERKGTDLPQYCVAAAKKVTRLDDDDGDDVAHVNVREDNESEQWD
jgi:hypothetical protein